MARPARVDAVFFALLLAGRVGWVACLSDCCITCREQYVTDYGTANGWFYESPATIRTLAEGLCTDFGCDATCNAGYYVATTSCVAMSGTPRCVACPGGKFTTTSSQSTCSTCTICKAEEVQVTACSSTQNTVCQACAAGKYRGTVGQFAECQTCGTCTATQIETTQCGPIYNRACQDCGAGQIVVSNTCTTCDAGKYTTDRITCKSCDTCNIGTYYTTACTSTQARVCATCGTGYTTSESNLNFCNQCADTYYNPSSVSPPSCVKCAANTACSQNYWQKCTGGLRSCEVCDGHNAANSNSCPEGKGITTKCDGTGLQNTVCTDCGAGFERPAGTPMIENIQKCVKCGMGKFKAAAGTANCASCTNKPVNSVYRNWDLGEAASTSSCPWYAVFLFFVWDGW